MKSNTHHLSNYKFRGKVFRYGQTAPQYAQIKRVRGEGAKSDNDFEKLTPTFSRVSHVFCLADGFSTQFGFLIVLFYVY